MIGHLLGSRYVCVTETHKGKHVNDFADLLQAEVAFCCKFSCLWHSALLPVFLFLRVMANVMTIAGNHPGQEMHARAHAHTRMQYMRVN